MMRYTFAHAARPFLVLTTIPDTVSLYICRHCMQDTFARLATARPSARAMIGYLVWRIIYLHSKHTPLIARITVTCMQYNFARARTRPSSRSAKLAPDDRVFPYNTVTFSNFVNRDQIFKSIYAFILITYNTFER